MIMVFGISSGDCTTKADNRKPKPAPRKFEISATEVAKKCSDGANHEEASTGGMASSPQLQQDKISCPVRAMA